MAYLSAVDPKLIERTWEDVMADILKDKKKSTLRRWQREGAGPPCLEIGRQVRYRRAAVERWSTGSIQAGSPDENR